MLRASVAIAAASFGPTPTAPGICVPRASVNNSTVPPFFTPRLFLVLFPRSASTASSST